MLRSGLWTSARGQRIFISRWDGKFLCRILPSAAEWGRDLSAKLLPSSLVFLRLCCTAYTSIRILSSNARLILTVSKWLKQMVSL